MLFRTRTILAFALSLSTLGLACSGGEPDQTGESAAPTAESAAPAQPTLAVASGVGMSNARMPMPGIVTGGQVTPGQVEVLSEAGFRHFISLRPATESGAGWEEAWAVEGATDFARLPIGGAGDLTRENVEAFAALLEDAGDDPTVIYCASGNRVGAMLALKAFWLDGVAPEDALQLGLDAGMTRLETPVRQILGL